MATFCVFLKDIDHIFYVPFDRVEFQCILTLFDRLNSAIQHKVVDFDRSEIQTVHIFCVSCSSIIGNGVKVILIGKYKLSLL